MPDKIDLTGKKFGHWTVLYEADAIVKHCCNEKRIYRDRRWHCVCDCENKTEKDMLQRSLLCGHSTHCGCVSKLGIPNINQRKYNKYDLSGEYGIGYTNNTQKEFWFDLEDYEIIKNYSWIEAPDGYISSQSRVDDACGQKTIKLHRLIMNVDDSNPYKVVPDHIHGKESRFDNRKSNLRIATASQNKMNIGLRKSNSSGITGICWSVEKNKWRAYITLNGKQKHLGYYENIEDAKNARFAAEDKMFGEFSYRNSQQIYN